ncbi:UNVERIFIED_CONTAM: hypothetical protein HDU68_005252 [Siphonaria sp. JEL0065]|nr:hypothetical protein HDU68_005252 [Siphonaria sp. JEL0065]
MTSEDDTDATSIGEGLLVNYCALFPLIVGIQVPLLQSIESVEGEEGQSLPPGFFNVCSQLVSRHGMRRLWTGHFSHFVYDSTSSFVKRALKPQLGFGVTTDVVSRLLLSPLELVQVRIMAQTYSPPKRKYAYSWTAIAQIAREEGWLALFAPKTWLPKILLEIVLSLDQYGIPLFLIRMCDLDPIASPIIYKSCRFALGMAASLVSLPLETVVNRMQIQVIPLPGVKVAKFETEVVTDQVQYKDALDCANRVVAEEVRWLKKSGRKGSKYGGFYRAWQGAIMANIFVALFQDSYEFQL